MERFHTSHWHQSDPGFRGEGILLCDAGMEGLPIISLKEVSAHDSVSDCWIVIFNQVFDITKFIFKHHGGESVLLEYAGRDATFTFLDAGHEFSSLTVLKRYLIGVLPKSEYLHYKILHSI